MINISKFAKILLLVIVALLPSAKAFADGGGKAIVAIADEPISAMSVLPKNSAEAENKYYVIRVKKRTETPAPLNAADAFEVLGFLHVATSNTLDLYKGQNITYEVSSNMADAWNIYAVDNATDGEHSHLVIKSAATGKYLNNSTTSAEHLSTSIAVNVDAASDANYFTMRPYADHYAHKKEVSKAEYDAFTGPESEKGTYTTGGHTEYWITIHEDIYDYSKHFMYLNGSNFKVHCDGNASDYHVTMADANSAMASSSTTYFNDYAENGQKDNIVFEIIEAEVATASTDVTYQFNVYDGTELLWHFYLQNQTVSDTPTTSEAIKNAFKNELEYYNNFTYVSTTDNNGYKHVTFNCAPNFPFLISKEIRSFDEASMNNQRLNFFTMSIGAPNDMDDGYYVGMENANPSYEREKAKMIKHGHYDGESSSPTGLDNYADKLMTDFHRHIDGALLWYACKATDEINDPNALRIYLFSKTTHPLVAKDAIHDPSYTDPEYTTYKEYDLDFTDNTYNTVKHDECKHDVFQIYKNADTNMPNGFSLRLKSDNSLVLASTHTGAGAPDKTFFKIARGTNALQTRLNAQSATDLVNIAVNSRGTNNVGGVNPTDFDYISETMLWYRLAYLYPTGNYPSSYAGYASISDYINNLRLYALSYIMETYPDYTTFEVNKKYRIELYHEGQENSSNKMLSSFESYMKDGGTAIAGAGMQNAKITTSILNGGTQSAADASTYWQIYPTDDKTPESGEEVEIAIYNPNVGAFLKKGTDGKAITFGPLCDFTENNATDASYADKFYVKQEGTSDQWVILSSRSTDNDVSKLSVVRGNEVIGTSPEAFDSEGNIKPTNTLYWSKQFDDIHRIEDYIYGADHDAHHGRWMFTAIAEYPMTITSAGWASVCLPFPVTFPADGIKAYYTSSLEEKAENDEGKGYEHNMILAKITESAGNYSIPANVAFLIKTDNGSAMNIPFTVGDTGMSSFSMTNDEKTKNIFKSVNAQWGHRDYDGDHKVADYTYYGLGNKKYGIAFYGIVATSGRQCYLPANKAYLDLSQIQQMIKDLTTQDQAAKASFMFVLPDDDLVTYINPATWEETVVPNDGIYYDLNGRRVMNPQKGVYVTSSGKKIVVK